MNNKERKLLQTNFARENLDYFFELLDSRFRPDLDSEYIEEIGRLSEGFNIRLTRHEKLKFCKKCKTYLDTKTCEIRFDSENKTKNYICKNCGNVRRFSYKD